jgi:hypothetical protein
MSNPYANPYAAKTEDPPPAMEKEETPAAAVSSDPVSEEDEYGDDFEDGVEEDQVQDQDETEEADPEVVGDVQEEEEEEKEEETPTASTDAKPTASSNPYAAAAAAPAAPARAAEPVSASDNSKKSKPVVASSNPYASAQSKVKAVASSSNPYATAAAANVSSGGGAPTTKKKKKLAPSADIQSSSESRRKPRSYQQPKAAAGGTFEEKFAKKMEMRKQKAEKANELTPAQKALKAKKEQKKKEHEKKQAALRAAAKISGTGSLGAVITPTEAKLKAAWIKKNPSMSNRKTRAELVKERAEEAAAKVNKNAIKGRESGWNRGGGSVRTMYATDGSLLTPEQVKAKQAGITPRNMGARVGSPRKKTRASIKDAWTKSRSKKVPLQGRTNGEAIRDPVIRKSHQESKAALEDVAKRLAGIKQNLVTPAEADNILEREAQARHARDRVYQFRVLLAKLQEYNELQAEEVADERARLREQEMHFEREMERRDLEKRAEMERTAKHEIMDDRIREKKRYESLKDVLRQTEEKLVTREVELDRRERDLRFRESTDEAKKWRDEMEIQRREFEMERDHFERAKRELRKTEHAMQMKIAELQDKLARAHASGDKQAWEYEQKTRERERVERATLRALEDKLIERELAVERKEAHLRLRDTEAYTELQQDYESEKARLESVRHERDELSDELAITKDKHTAIVDTLESKISNLQTQVDAKDHAAGHPANDIKELQNENEMLKLKLAEQAFATRLAQEKQDRTATRLGDYKAQHQLAKQGYEEVARKYSEYKRWAPDQPHSSAGLPSHLLSGDVSSVPVGGSTQKPKFSGWGSGPIAKHKLGAKQRLTSSSSSSSSSVANAIIHCYSCGQAFPLRKLADHLSYCPQQRAEALKKQMGDAYVPLLAPSVPLPQPQRHPTEHELRVYDNEALRVYESTISCDAVAFYA